MGCTLKVQYKEHIQAIRTKKQNSNYTQHIIDTEYTCNTIDQTLGILYIEKKGQLLNTLKLFHTYNLSRQKLQMNDTFTDIYNSIFNLLLHLLHFKIIAV
jgi:hypothetical protein